MESAAAPSGHSRPPSGCKKKGRAPPPPKPPSTHKENNENELTKDLEIFSDQCVINMKENLINRTVDVTVVFPDGEEEKLTLHGTKAMVDLLVDLCNLYHLNPDHHTLELQSLDSQQTLNYKPNTLIGGLDVWKILLKKKYPEEKTRMLSPKIPEKTTTLVVNYLKTQKAVIQVNPELPLRSIVPAICEKCEVSQEYLVLLRDTFTGEELELTKSLNELGIKELYVWDRQRELRSCDTIEKEKRRFLGFFRTNKRSSKGITTAPNSPSMNSCSVTLGPSLSLGSISGTASSIEVKKRRAPPPPPATIPQFQSAEAIEREKSLGEQMSQGSSQNEFQKKKRRAPPPPTPPMPSRTEEMEEKRKSTVGELQWAQEVYNSEDMAVKQPEIEETESVSSCLTSEDTGEDFGVTSSSSDIMSLDSQISAQETLSEVDPLLLAKAGPIKNSTFDSEMQKNIYQRFEDTMVGTKFENSDAFITSQLQETLAALDKDLEVMESMHDDSQSRSVSSKLNGTSNSFPHSADTEDVGDTSLPVPVTIIDDVPEVDITIYAKREDQNPFFSKTREADEVILTDPFSLVCMVEDNNAGSSTYGHKDTETLSKILLQQNSLKEEIKGQTEEKQNYECDPCKSPCEKGNLALKILPKNGVIASDSGLTNTGDRENEETEEGLQNKTKTELELRRASARIPDEKKDVSLPPLWCNRIHNGMANYEPKVGLTTFKVVPPKPEVKCFDRDVSLSTGAIKIDELGNLVPLDVGGVRTDATKTEEILTGRTKAYWRSNCTKTQLDERSLGLSTKLMATTNRKPLNKELVSSGVSSTGDRVGPEEGMSVSHATQPSVKTAVKPQVHSDKMELLLQNSQRRPSTQYVASGVAKCVDTTQLKTNQERHNKEEAYKEKAIVSENTPLSRRCTVAAKSFPAETHTSSREGSCSTIFNCSKNSLNHLQNSSRIRNSTIKPLNHNKPMTYHSKSLTIVPCTDGDIPGEPRCGTIQNVIIKETSCVLNPNGKKIGQSSCPFFRRSYDINSAPIIINSSARSPGGQTINSQSSELNSTPIVSCGSSEKYDELNNVPTRTEIESKIRDDDISKVFGPKKKFKPVIQKPPPKDTSLHSALMEAIQTAGGKERLRKVSQNTDSEIKKKPLFREQENGHSALLAAIRDHRGTSQLRKISSSASEELLHSRNTETLQNREASIRERECKEVRPPPSLCLSARKTQRNLSGKIAENPADARKALMEAIRSGSGAERLRKVPLPV